MADYINFPSGFNITTTLPIDKRLVMTKAEMLATLKGVMPDYYLVICKDDHRLYIYDKSLEKDPVIGRYRPIEDYLNFTSSAAASIFNTAVSNSTAFSNLSSRVSSLALDVDDLDHEVHDISTQGTLAYRVNQVDHEVRDLENITSNLEDATSTLELRVDDAEDNITEILSWDITLDGGEILWQE